MSARTEILDLLKNHPNQWFDTSKIATTLPNLTKTSIYVAISDLARHATGVTRKPKANNSGFEYSVQVQDVHKPPAQKTKQLIRWSHDEKLAFAKSYVKVQHESPDAAPHVKYDTAQMIALPIRRRRSNLRTTDLPWLNDYMALVATDKAPEPVTPAVQAAPVPEVQAAPVPEVQTPVEVAPAAAGPFDILLERFAQQMKKVIVDVLTSPEVQSALTINVRLAFDQIPQVTQPAAAAVEPAVPTARTAAAIAEAGRLSTVTQPAPTARKRLKRVLVVGLLPNQIHEMEREFKDTLDLRFWKTGENINTLRSKAGQVDITVLVTDFISHAQQSMIRSIKNAKFAYHTGGMTRLKDLLTEIYVNDK